MKEAGRTTSRDGSFNTNGAAKGAADGPAKSRKISIGPIDFEKRREHIRLAYSKSIRESQAQEARRKAADQRQKEMEAAARAKISAESLARTAEAERPTSFDMTAPKAAQQGPPSGPRSGESAAAHGGPSPATQPTVDAPAPPSMPPPLVVSTALSRPAAPEPATPDPDSPTLGLPGCFPALASARGTPQEQPLPAASPTSETIEFDGEPQTNPPIQADAPLDAAVAVVKPPSPAPSMPPGAPAAECQDPFEEDAEFHDAPMVQEDLETTTRAAPAPTVEADDDDEPRASEPASEPADEPRAAEPADAHPAPQALPLDDDDDDAVAATLPLPEEEADADETPQAVPRVEPQVEPQTAPWPRPDAQDESDCHSGLGSARPDGDDSHCDIDDDAATDACTEETDDGERVELRRPDFGFADRPSDEPASHRASSTCDSSEPGAVHGGQDGLVHGHTPSVAMPPNLAVPPPSSPRHDGLSQQSTWTDFSVDSTDASEAARRAVLGARESAAAFGHVTIFESTTTAARESLGSYRDAQYASDMQSTDDSQRSSECFSPHQLPELDTGAGFSIPYLTSVADTSLSHLPSPSHEPPPVPSSTPGSALDSRTSSVFYDQSQFSSTLVNSERESDEYNSQMQTPQSMDAASMETAEQYFGSHAPADGEAKSLAPDADEPTGKERHRLVQRRNVIKELIDTEAVFVRDMNIVEEIYKGTAEACPKLDAKTVKLIFRNSEEIIDFHTAFLVQLRQAVSSVYVPKGAPAQRDDWSLDSEQSQGGAAGPNDARDRATSLGPAFQANLEKMKTAHEGFLRNSDQAAKRLIQIQQDATVKVWLNECNEVAKDLTAAWDLDSLLIKPMQRLTKYPTLILTLLQHTPQDHPDREPLAAAKDALETAIVEINRTKKNFELVGQIVGRKRKESDVRAGFARAFGKRVDKLQASSSRVAEDAEYMKLNDKFGDDYLRLQVVLRDVEFYTRQASSYVHEFLQYLSSIELVMRLQPGSYPELESKWVQFNISVRDLEKVALEEHVGAARGRFFFFFLVCLVLLTAWQLAQVRKQVIEPFEHVIKAYGNPSLAMKKRQKRRLDYERCEQLKRAGKTVDPKLRELVEQYDALNDTLKKELPMLSSLTERVGNICLGNFVKIQASWYYTWKEKMKTVLGDCGDMVDLDEVVATFQREYPFVHEQLMSIGILNPATWGTWGRNSQSTATSVDDSTMRSRTRAAETETRERGLSAHDDAPPTLPAPDFGRRRSGSFTTSSGASGAGGGGVGGGMGGMGSNLHHYYYRDYYVGGGSASPRSPEIAGSSRSGAGATSTRPSTGRSFDSGVAPRPSSESAVMQQRRDSNTTYNSSHQPHEGGRRYSNLFHSALPLPDEAEESQRSQRSSRASSRERRQGSGGYNILWLAASLFEFNIATTKHEAGYPYLTYQAGEVSVWREEECGWMMS